MEYIVLDMEWNQAENKHKMIREPFVFSGEIIQIGAAKVNEKLEVLDTFNVYIKPVFYSKICQRVTQVTGIRLVDLVNGVRFKDAAEAFRQWCGDCPFVTWGTDDFYVLRDNLLIHDMDASWLPEFFDAQEIFDDQVMQEGRQFALSYAIYHFRIRCMAAHNALNDTLNTISVLRKLDFLKGVEDQHNWYYAAAM